MRTPAKALNSFPNILSAIVLSVIIVSYNVKYFLEQCLCSVYKAGRRIDMEVIVVDNFSSDGSREYLEPAFPWVKFYWNKENAGFAKGCNFGLKHAQGAYILFLNPDTIVGEDCFEKCIDFLRSHTQPGALGVRMIDESGRFLKESKRAFPSPTASFFKLGGLATLFPGSGFFARYYLGNLAENRPHEVDVIAGAFMMIKREVLDITGGFDEAFFMYGEDIDLSYRIQKQGYKNYYYPAVTILHFKGKSTPRKDMRYVRTFYRAMHIFVDKHYGKSRSGVYHFCIQAAIWSGAGIAIVAHWIRNNINTVKNKIRGQGTKPQVFILGEEQSYNTILPLISHTNNGDAGWLILSPAEQNAVWNTRSPEHILDTHRIKNIVVCEGEHSFADIIKLIERTGNTKRRIAIHAAQSKSFAGGYGAGL